MTKYIISIILVVFVGSCIEPYDFNTDVEFKSFPVIEGTIVDQPEDGYYQHIRISKSSKLEVKRFEQVTNAEVIVHNGNGDYYLFEHDQNTNSYKAHIPPEDLVPGSEFQLEVNIAGEIFRSEIETMHPCPEIDSIYYEIDNLEGAELGSGTTGASFFVNFIADKSFGAFYRIIAEETHEYHAQWPIETYYDANNRYHTGTVNWSKFYCWQTEDLPNIYTLSTDGFTQNTYIKLPIHFVPNTTQRLRHNYSVNIKQYSLTEHAFNYWHSLKNNNQESFDMFGKQPATINSNIYKVSDPELRILGYFGVSAVKQKRLTINGGVKDIPYNIFQCTLNALEFGIPWRPRPLYLAQTELNGRTYWGTAPTYCWDCTEYGGSTTKPEFFE